MLLMNNRSGRNFRALYDTAIKRQSGFVLVLSLVILLVLSIVVVSVNSSVIAQEKMVASTKQANLALEAAENALRVAELRLKNTAATNLDDLVDTLKISESGEVEGSYFETENQYELLVYYRPPGTQFDYVVGYTTFNSSTY